MGVRSQGIGTGRSKSYHCLCPLPTPCSEGTNGPRPHCRPRRRARLAGRGQGSPARRRQRRGHADLQPDHNLAPACGGRARPRAHHAELVAVPRRLADRPHVRLPLRPVQSIDAVQLYARPTTVETLNPDLFLLDGAGVPARLVRQGALAWPPAQAHRQRHRDRLHRRLRQCGRRRARPPSARPSCCSSPTGTSTASRSRSAPRKRACRTWSPSCCSPIAG